MAAGQRRYRIAVIPGDGIGKETVPEGVRGAGAGGQAPRLHAAAGLVRLLVLRLLRQARPHDAGGLEGADRRARRDLPSAGRLAGTRFPTSSRCGTRCCCSGASSISTINLRPVRLLPGVPLAARRPQARRHRFLGRAREHRGRVFLHRRPDVPGHRARIRGPGIDLHPPRHRPGAALRLRAGAVRPKRHLTSATKSNGISITMPFWDERVVAMAEHYPDVRWDKYHIDILTAHFVLHPDWFDVVVASNLFGDILSDLGRPAPARSASRRPAHQPEPRPALAVRAGPRLGAGHRRAGHRQPDRPDLVGRDDAGASRRGRGRRRDRGGHRAGAGGAHPAHRDLGGNADTTACGQAVAEAIG